MSLFGKFSPSRSWITVFCFLFAWSFSYAAENADYRRGHTLYQHGAGERADFSEAFSAFERAAQAEDPSSQFYLGRMYQLGHGVEQDLELAAIWYRRAAEARQARAWNNLANVYLAMDAPVPGEKILQCYRNASDMGMAMGSYNIGSVFFVGKHGLDRDYRKALAYYEKALAQYPGYPGAWNNIGRIHERGGFGVARDLEAAEEAYLKAALESQDKHGYYNLYDLYWDGDRPDARDKLRAYQQKAAELGHAQAAYEAAHHYQYGVRTEKDPVRAAYFYELAAKNGHGFSKYKIFQLSKDAALIAHYGPEVTEHWRTYFREHRKAARETAIRDLAIAKELFDKKQEALAAAGMAAALRRWQERTVDEYSDRYLARYWWEAQTQSGRSELAWSAFVYDWLAGQYDRIPTVSTGRIGARSNLSERLISLGRFGALREVCQEIKSQILAQEGVDVDAVRGNSRIDSNYAFSSAAMPVRLDYDRVSHRKGWRDRNELLSANTFDGLHKLSQERLSVGDWESSLFYADWMRHWILHIERSGEKPARTFSGYHAAIDEMAHFSKADVFVALGLFERAAEAYRHIIEREHDHYGYGGSGRQCAAYELARLQIRHGLEVSLSAAELEALEAKVRENKFLSSHEWQFVRLVRGRLLASEGESAAGIDLVGDVLDHTLDRELPLLRLEALLTAAEIRLDAGMSDGCEAWLQEALTWARSQGLLIEELRVYRQYVRYLIVTGQYELALEMQQRVLELIDALNLSPRRDMADLRLAEIYALLGRASAAEALLAQIKDPALVGAVAEIRGRFASEGGGSASQNAGVLDLQPLRIVSAPLAEQTRAVFMLTNLSPETVAFDLDLSARALELATDSVTEMYLAFDFQAVGTGESSRRSVSATIAGSSQLPIQLSVPRLGDLEDYRVRIGVRAEGQARSLESEWMIDLEAGTAPVAVVDAAYIRENPFYLASVYHHIARRADAVGKTALRAVASEPTRVEAYDEAGKLLFVDAEGNGSFADSGDLVASEDVYGLNPVLAFDRDERQIEFRYQPLDRTDAARVDIRIETHGMSNDDSWEASAVDWLER
ncbi:MAG TPA: SEL1-like repeat protein [Opitutales bacterium]|nr:SEL1-like repeat protein [Opitutales bacterium]